MLTMRSRPPCGEAPVHRRRPRLRGQTPGLARLAARRHPTSTAGRISGRKCGTANPAHPIIVAAGPVDQRLEAEAVGLVTRDHPLEELLVSSAVMPPRNGYHQNDSSA